jgi:hypothetical protein
VEMFRDQIEVYRRGALDLPQMLIPDELLDQTQFEQYNELTIEDFPVAHVIPNDGPLQESAQQAARLVDFLLFNDVEVEQASKAFTIDGTTYPAGSYVVWMDQPKRGLANTILGDGRDLSDVVGITFYSPPAVWSHPLLWGASRTVVTDELSISTHPVSNADQVRGSLTGRSAAAYAFEPTTLTAIQVVNDLVRNGVAVQRATSDFVDGGTTFEPGTFIVPADRALATSLANEHSLDVYALRTMPDSVPMTPQKVAVFGDEGVEYALDQLGFEYDTVSTSDVNSGAVENYDVFVNYSRSWTGLSDAGRASLTAFFAAGGDYVGLRSTGIGLAQAAGIIDVSVDAESGNAIVDVEYSSSSSAAGGYPDVDEAFVFTPAWFTSVGADVETVATIGDGDFLVSGYWPDWELSGAAGMPVVVSGDNGDGDVTLIGLDATFRGHPENTFRLLANGIFDGLDAS